MCAISFLYSVELIGQTANKIINKVYLQLQKAKDYQADATIKVDLPFVKMAQISAEIYFRQPNQFKVVSKSITIVPRQGIDQLQRILSDTSEFTAVLQNMEIISQTPVQIISLIPMRDTGDLVLAKLWIDPKQNLVLKSLLTTKNNGTILTDYVYGQYAKYALPDRMTFTVDIKKFKIPKTIAADINTSSQSAGAKSPEKRKGQIHIALSNYQINRGLAEAYFKKEKKK